jgi:hypothetical protein
MAKVALVVVGIIAGIAGAALLWTDWMLSDLCGNTVIAEAVSPSGKTKAVLFERSCGATTGFSSQLSIVAAHGNLRNDSGNAFIADGYPEGYSLRWLDDSTLELTGVTGRVHKREPQISGVEIHYE